MSDARYLVVTLALNAANGRLTDRQYREFVLNSVGGMPEVQNWIKNNPDKARELLACIEQVKFQRKKPVDDQINCIAMGLYCF